MLMRKFVKLTKIPALAFGLMLTACGGGGDSTPTVVAPAPPVSLPSVPDLTRNKLLTDAELQTSALTPSPTVNATYANWVRNNHYPIRSITYDQDFSDLTFLKGLIGDRPVVQLGESSHGTREFNHVKTRLIKYLHQEMGFSVVAIESGFFEGIYADTQRETGSADSLMQFIFGVWQTNEVLELFQYVKDTQSGPNSLRLIGFDPQISSSNYARIGGYIEDIPTSPGFSQTLKDELVADLSNFRALEIQFGNQDCVQQASQACQGTIDLMDALKTSLTSAETSLASISNPSEPLKILSIAVFAAMGQIDASTAGYTGGDYGVVRDKNMASIFGRIRQDVYPDEKIVVWAHNRHIAHQESPTLDDSGQFIFLQETMGFHLKNEIPTELYTIGLYMLRGATADNSRRSIPVSLPADNSIESIAHSVRKAAIFIDSQPNQAQTTGNEFLFERTFAHFWGGSFGSYSMIPSDQFDGLLIIDQSSLPSYR